MRAAFLTLQTTQIARISLILVCLLWITPQLRADWGGSASGNASSTSVKSLRSVSYDQEYFLYTGGQPTKAVRYSLTGVFRHLQNRSNDGLANWSTEVRPGGAIHWTTGLLDLRGDAAYRSNRDKLGSAKLTDRSAGIFAQTNLAGLPQMFGSVNWAKNVNDLDLLGYDTRTRNLVTGATYTSNRFFGNYSFSNLLVVNSNQNLKHSSDSHTGRMDYSFSPVKRLVNLQTSYQIVSRSEKNFSSSTGQSLVVLPAAAGLYLDDTSPDFDALEPAPGLNDGLLEVAAGDSFDLVNGSFHNIGLDFGAATEIDHLHLYVDTLATTSQAWSIWISSDNLNWSRVSENAPTDFNPTFRRFEFAFASLTTRYIKLTATPQLLITPIRVSELRGLVTRFGTEDIDRTTDHRGSARLQFSPAKWLHAEIGGEGVRQTVSQVALAREEDVLQSSLHFVPTDVANLTVRYQWNATRYPGSSGEGVSSTAAAVVRSTWTRAIATLSSLERREEKTGAVRSRRGDYARFEVNTLLLPALRSSSQFNYSEDERFESRDKVISRTVAQSLDGEPTPRSQVNLAYRYNTISAWISAPRRYRVSLSGRVNYRATDTISIASTASMSMDPTREDRSYDGIVSWTPTQKLSFGGSFSRIEGDQTENSTLYSMQMIFQWTARTDLNGSVSLNDNSNSGTITTSSVSLLTRF